MFWLQVLIPIALASIGLLLLNADSKNRNNNIKRTFDYSKEKIVEISERQQDNTEIRNRLSELGKVNGNSYGEFRYRQLLIATGAGLLPFLALFLILIDLITAIGLSLFFGIGTYFLYDKYLTTQVKRQRDQVDAEFPAIIEMLTLAIAAGETPISAFARIAERSKSALADEFEKVVKDVRSGRPFHESLDHMGRNLKSSTIRRFIDALVMAMVRGAPIVEVLHRHVAEARMNQRNLVMDKAGKAETTMMIPIVFLILPISVLFALWPSINQLSFFAS